MGSAKALAERLQQRFMIGIAIVLASATCFALPMQLASPQEAVDELFAADAAFSAAGAKTDVISSLSAMFADDVTMPYAGGQFAEGRENAIEALRSTADNARSRADWVPIGGGVSADGRHGFTFGFMTVHPHSGGAPSPLKYLSYWVKRSEGWRVIAYKRARRPEGEVSFARMPPVLPARLVAPSTDPVVVAKVADTLDQAERSFSDDAQQIGLGPAFAQYGAADAINMGGPDSSGFVVGAEKISRSVSAGQPAGPATISWAPFKVIVATSGDLGVSIGWIKPNAPAADGAPAPGIPFFTIWRRATTADPWRYVAE
jgi:ketosteroid isomerase-like protein